MRIRTARLKEAAEKLDFCVLVFLGNVLSLAPCFPML
jgi:hypothetical protein